MANELVVKNGLKVDTTTGALNVPSLTTTQRNALSPTAGAVIYNNTTAAYEIYNGSTWVNQIAYQNSGVNLFYYYNFI